MATERQVAANRANSKKSTGPKSRGGKRRASQNAYRHGLAGGGLLDSDWTAVEQQARDIVDSTGGKIDLFYARSIAQAQQEVLRARSISTAVVSKALAIHVDESAVPSSAERSPQGNVGAGAIELAVPLLRVLDRYEHRALAKRNKAIRVTLRDDFEDP